MMQAQDEGAQNGVLTGTDSTAKAQLTEGALATNYDTVRDVQRTICCAVGGGPAGAVLALLLARQGIPVTLLERHGDFDRDFRGETIHPSVMEIMDELGLADRLLLLPHTKIRGATIQTAIGPVVFPDFGRLKTRFPYIVLLPQASFLEFITYEAKKYPHFRLVMGASVQEILEEDGVIRGVCYRGRDGLHEVRALLTMGTDGRFSRIRRLAGFEPVETVPPLDILWFRLPRKPEDPEGAFAHVQGGQVIGFERSGQWQIAYLVPKGSYRQIHAAGLEALRRSFVEMAPEFADRVGHLEDWKQISVLSVGSDRLSRWYRPGLLVIGDAAHVMSPVGGVGINYAIQDAVVAANVLGGPLKAAQTQLKDLDVRYLAAVQRRREWPTRAIQALQALAERRVRQRIIAATSEPSKSSRLPMLPRLLLRLPVARDLPARVIAFGVWPVHVKNKEVSHPSLPSSSFGS